MGVHIDIRYQHRAAVVTLAGEADLTGLSLWAEPLGEAAGAEVVVVDLDQARLADEKTLAYLLALFDGGDRPDRLHLVARRSSVTGQLVAWKIHHRIAIHPNVNDALRAAGGPAV